MTPNLLASPSLAQIEGLTKAAFLKRFLRDTGLGVYGTVTAADSADTFVDTTSRASVKFSDSLYEGWWVRVSAAGSATRLGQCSHRLRESRPRGQHCLLRLPAPTSPRIGYR